MAKWVMSSLSCVVKKPSTSSCLNIPQWNSHNLKIKSKFDEHPKRIIIKKPNSTSVDLYKCSTVVSIVSSQLNVKRSMDYDFVCIDLFEFGPNCLKGWLKSPSSRVDLIQTANTDNSFRVPLVRVLPATELDYFRIANLLNCRKRNRNQKVL